MAFFTSTPSLFLSLGLRLTTASTSTQILPRHPLQNSNSLCYANTLRYHCSLALATTFLSNKTTSQPWQISTATTPSIRARA
ncbi:hypothetical protein SNOG_07085 [Parastagonospora nodorum SN15]|uniref:Secreted protein n=1 Tax=Phaeosphaeria nodorum (strain SN15 / ATCC MYA-4574 / FGSC 10173) TaxID=321614 RepID=Q0UMC9_PHANO|nr:hypothetical protein SNOG_07085 [Parastagonospora nodorum SN15]EAT85736.2 hypothetical protein SNOG_07085 [Parastagonospora nodorum SN15]